jgi:phosphopantothenate-cysteine ligase/phosphopantothenoylcysteine decarboxylase/phosphopantothenate--cysteine ligase
VAVEAYRRGHAVACLTSHPEVFAELAAGERFDPARWVVQPYRTYDDLLERMGSHVRPGGFDAVIHASAVSDYATAGVYAPVTRFDPAALRFEGGDGPQLADVSAGKVKSHHGELWLRLTPTVKIIDLIRPEWRFGGVLVKFKLEVGVTDDELLVIAERSRQASAADAMVANTLDGMQAVAYLGVRGAAYERLTRDELAPRLLAVVERLHAERP